MDKVIVYLDERELNTVLAALRVLQANTTLIPEEFKEDGILSKDEVDVLCERINTAETFSKEDVSIILEALDSHEYWQLTDEADRNDGASMVEDGKNPEIDACRAVQAKVSRILCEED